MKKNQNEGSKSKNTNKEEIKEKIKNNPKTKKSKKINKKMIFSIIFILLLVGIIFIIFNSEDEPIPPKPASIINFEGNVQVFTNGSWITPIKNQELYLGDKIKTTDGIATLSLYSKAFVYLEEDTEIEISSLVENDLKISQLLGKTFNKFLGVVKTNSYSVETPNAVATVRGTEFGINLEELNETLNVEEGSVSFKVGEEEVILDRFEKGIYDKTNKTLRKIPLSKEEIKEIVENKNKQITSIKSKRIEMIEENKMLLKIAESTYGLSKEDIIEKLDAIDRGEIDDEALIEQAPIKKDELRKIKRLNDKIKVLNNDIEEVTSKYNYTREDFE